MNKLTKLNKLKNALAKFVAILELDPNCQWTKGFKSDLSRCEELIQNGYTADDLRSLSSSITYVFKGMGSFNDYGPGIYHPETGRYSPIPGTENFDKIKNEVFDLAILLRAIEPTA